MENEYEDIEVRNDSPLSKLIKWTLSIILIILLIILIVWLVKGKGTTNNKNNTNNAFDPLLAQIFNNNIDIMKNAAMDYYSIDKVPTKEGQTLKMTLQDMLELKLLLPLVDKNGKECSITDSYTEITKVGSKYELKVNLSCSDEEDYIIVYLGCYDYCKNYVCEEKKKDEVTNSSTKETNPSCSLKVVSGTLGTNNRYKTNVTVGFNGTSASTNGKVTASGIGLKQNYTDSTYTITKDGTYTVYGYVKDSNGKTATCAIKVTKYTPSTTKEYEYLYEKKVERTYSEWSDWSKDKYYTANDNIVFGKQELVWNEKNGADAIINVKYEKDVNSPIWQVKYDRVVGTYKDYVCDGYKYYRSTNGTTYQLGEWKYLKTITDATSIPEDTATTRYLPQGMNYDICKNDCTSHPVYIIKVETRTSTAKTGTEQELSAKCNVVTENVPIYGSRRVLVGYASNKIEEVTGYKYKYHTKTRTVVKEAYTDQKWSSSTNDKTLIANGYTYTGQKRAK